MNCLTAVSSTIETFDLAAVAPLRFHSCHSCVLSTSTQWALRRTHVAGVVLCYKLDAMDSVRSDDGLRAELTTVDETAL